MAATFESFVHPFVVMFTIPLALVGVVLGLLVTGTEISVIVLIGAVMLVGIVVNNAIVLVDKVNQLRRAGRRQGRGSGARGAHPASSDPHDDAHHRAGARADGALLGRGLGAALAAGHHGGVRARSSTLLTLVVIPAVYMAVPSHVAVEEPEPLALPARGAAAEGPAS